MTNIFRMVRNLLNLVLVVMLGLHLVFDRSYPVTPFAQSGWMMIPGLVFVVLSAVLIAEMLRKPHERKARLIVRAVIGLIVAAFFLLLPFQIYGIAVGLVLLVSGWKKKDTRFEDTRHLRVSLALCMFLVFAYYYGGALMIFNIKDLLSSAIVLAAMFVFQLWLGIHIFASDPHAAHGAHGNAHP